MHDTGFGVNCRDCRITAAECHQLIFQFHVTCGNMGSQLHISAGNQFVLWSFQHYILNRVAEIYLGSADNATLAGGCYSNLARSAGSNITICVHCGQFCI